MDEMFEVVGIDYDATVKGTRQVERRFVSKSDIKNGLNSFLVSFSDILDSCKSKIGEFELNEIDLKVEISFTGSIRLIGSVEAGSTGAMTLKLKRRKDE